MNPHEIRPLRPYRVSQDIINDFARFFELYHISERDYEDRINNGVKKDEMLYELPEDLFKI